MFPTFTPTELEQRWTQLTRGSQKGTWAQEVHKRVANAKVLLAVCKELFKNERGSNKGYIAVTASTFFQYFRTLDPDYGASAWALATASLLLASKLYNTNKSIVEITKLSLKYRCARDPTYRGLEHLIDQDAAWLERHLAQVRSCEADLLVGIDFDLEYKNPHMLLLCRAKDLGMCPHLDIHANLRTPARSTPRSGSGGSNSGAGAAQRRAADKRPQQLTAEEQDLLQFAVNFINDSASSTMPLEFTSAELAIGALFLAIEQRQYRPKLPKPHMSFTGSFDISPERLETVVLRYRRLYQSDEMVCMDVPALVAADVARATGSTQQVQEQVLGAAFSPAQQAADAKASPGAPSGVSSKTTADPPVGVASGAAAAADPGSPGSVGRANSPPAAAAVNGASNGVMKPGGGSLLPSTAATNCIRPSGSSPAQGHTGKRKRASDDGQAAGSQQHHSVATEAAAGEPRPKRQVCFDLPPNTCACSS